MATVAVTGGVTMGAAGVATVLMWASGGFTSPMPNDVALVLASLILIAGHGGYVAVMALAKRWGVTVPAEPQADPATTTAK